MPLTISGVILTCNGRQEAYGAIRGKKWQQNAIATADAKYKAWFYDSWVVRQQ